MSSAITQAQTAQPTSATNKLAVDFSHRLSTDGVDIGDNIGLMTERALGVLHLLSIQFEVKWTPKSRQISS